MTQFHAVLLAIAGLLVRINHSDINKARKFNIYWNALLISLAIYSSVNLYQCGIYPWSIIWISTALINLKNPKRSTSNSEIEYEL
jgi:hypothetical protein